MKQINGKIILDGEEFLANCIFTGTAIEILSSASEEDINAWVERLADLTNAKIDKMTVKQKQAMINAYVRISNDKKE